MRFLVLVLPSLSLIQRSVCIQGAARSALGFWGLILPPQQSPALGAKLAKHPATSANPPSFP